jgi:hypothetical protein
MCFGDNQTVDTKTTNNTLPGYLSDAAQWNVGNAMNFAQTPFQTYTGQLTAPLTADQNTAGNIVRNAATSSNQYLPSIESMFSGYAGAPAQSITAPSILGANVDPSKTSISDYMNPYTAAVLSPTLQEIARQSALNANNINARATFAGAYGDTGNALQLARNTADTNKLMADTTANAYSNAFTTGAGLKQSDLANFMNAQNANAGYNEQALARQQQGGQDFLNLDQYNQNRAYTGGQALGQVGQTQQQTQQAADTANYQEFLRGQQWTPQQIALLTSVLSGTPHDTTQVTTDQKPDNSGYQMLGTLGGTLLSAFI